jgi:hypothetical protein
MNIHTYAHPSLSLRNARHSHTYTRRSLEEKNKHNFNAFAAALVKYSKKHKKLLSSCESLILTGGGSRILKLQESLFLILGKRFRKSYDSRIAPQDVVAHGAAVKADLIRRKYLKVGPGASAFNRAAILHEGNEEEGLAECISGSTHAEDASEALELVQVLLSRGGIDLDRPGKDGSFLHVALGCFADLTIWRLLVKAGANLRVKNSAGKTALQQAWFEYINYAAHPTKLAKQIASRLKAIIAYLTEVRDSDPPADGEDDDSGALPVCNCGLPALRVANESPGDSSTFDHAWRCGHPYLDIDASKGDENYGCGFVKNKSVDDAGESKGDDGESKVGGAAAVGNGVVTGVGGGPHFKAFLAGDREALVRLCSWGGSGDPEECRTLVAHEDIDIDYRAASDGATAVLRASRHNRLEIVNILIEAGAHLNYACAEKGALHWATTMMHVGVVEALLAAGPSIDVVGTGIHSVMTPLQYV